MDGSAVLALRNLAVGYAEAAGNEWPQAAEREVTLLHDVVLALGGDERQLEQVLGERAVQLVAAVMDGTP